MTLTNIHLTLTEVRKERNVGQKDIAEALNIEQATVSMYENGKRGIPLNLLDQWCKLLEITITITPKGYEPIKPVEATENDLETFQQLKKRRNYLIAELRAMMAEKVAQVPELQQQDDESGEGLFWAYSFHGNHDIGVVETRYDHPEQKHLAVEYTGSEVNVYKFLSTEKADDESDRDRLGIDRVYFSEDDFLKFGGYWDFKSMEARKVTILRLNEKHPDGFELVNAEGFSLSALMDMQENHTAFLEAYEAAIEQDAYKNMQAELLAIEDKLFRILMDNRLSNGTGNAKFKLWTEDDQSAVDVPLYGETRSWNWIEEGVMWADDAIGAIEVKLTRDSTIHEHYITHLDEDGNRVIGLFGSEQKPAVFKINPEHPGILYRVETALDELNEPEVVEYEKILKFTADLDELKNK